MNANYKIERTENGCYLVKIEKCKKCTFTTFHKAAKAVESETFYYFDNITERINEQKEFYKAIGRKVIDVTKENETVKTRVLCDNIVTEWEKV